MIMKKVDRGTSSEGSVFQGGSRSLKVEPRSFKVVFGPLRWNLGSPWWVSVSQVKSVSFEVKLLLSSKIRNQDTR